MRTLQKTNVYENDWSTRLPDDWSRLPNDMLGNGCNIMAQIQSGFFGTAANGAGELKNPNEQAKASNHIHKQLSSQVEILVN